MLAAASCVNSQMWRGTAARSWLNLGWLASCAKGPQMSFGEYHKLPGFFLEIIGKSATKTKKNTLAPVSCCTCGGIIGLPSKRVVLTDSSHVWLTWKALELDQPTVEVEEPWWQDLCSITKNQDVFRFAASDHIVPQINGSSRGSTSSILLFFPIRMDVFVTIYFGKIMDKHRIKVRLLRSTQEWRVELELMLQEVVELHPSPNAGDALECRLSSTLQPDKNQVFKSISWKEATELDFPKKKLILLT